MKNELKPFSVDEDNWRMITSRKINASPELLYQLFTTAEHIDKWYGPKGCYSVTSELEVKEGGSWKYTMHMPNGKSFDAFHTFTEIKENKRLVFISAQQPDAPEEQWFTTEIDLLPTEDGTEVKITMSYKSDAMFDQAKQFGGIRGYVSTLEKLEEYAKSL